VNVLLLNPSWDSLVSKRGGRFNRAWPPLDLLNCGALLEREGIRVELIDGRATPGRAQEMAARTFAADKVFITSSPLDRWQCPNLEIERFFETVAPFRKDNLYIMGVHGDRYPELVLERTGARAIIRGEPELTVLRICQTDDLSQVRGLTYKADGRIVKTENASLLEMTDLPIPAYHLVDLDDYGYELMGDRFALLETTRGCPFPCMYCFLEMYGGRRYRRKSVEQITAEVDYIVRVARAKSLYFIDLEFTLGESRHIHALCDHMITQGYDLPWCCQTRADSFDAELLAKMKRAGCRMIHFGVETGSEKVMSTIDKKITLPAIERGIAMARRAGIETACFFMFGFPGETSDDMDATIEFARKLNPTYASFHIASPYPGTELYAMSGSTELFPEAYTKEHSLTGLEATVRRAFKRFYLRPQYAWSRITEGSPAAWKKQFKLFWAFIH
jgi:radical SAM superfamily enzyme YgiQ (UPF0313 family)